MDNYLLIKYKRILYIFLEINHDVIISENEIHFSFKNLMKLI